MVVINGSRWKTDERLRGHPQEPPSYWECLVEMFPLEDHSSTLALSTSACNPDTSSDQVQIIHMALHIVADNHKGHFMILPPASSDLSPSHGSDSETTIAQSRWSSCPQRDLVAPNRSKHNEKNSNWLHHAEETPKHPLHQSLTTFGHEWDERSSNSMSSLDSMPRCPHRWNIVQP